MQLFRVESHTATLYGELFIRDTKPDNARKRASEILDVPEESILVVAYRGTPPTDSWVLNAA